MNSVNFNSSGFAKSFVTSRINGGNGSGGGSVGNNYTIKSLNSKNIDFSASHN